MRNEIDCIREWIIDRENESSDGNSDTVLGVWNRKITIIDNECESDSDAPQDSNNSKWTACEESSKTLPRIKFIAGGKSTETQVSLNVVKQCCKISLKIFFANELIN